MVGEVRKMGGMAGMGGEGRMGGEEIGWCGVVVSTIEVRVKGRVRVTITRRRSGRVVGIG